ncbi:ataxin-3-like isoform X1 [Polistes fuscatus]|uniref:ataxin-3-like isoform X1 n=2 Tax=Polistes fuscatus TaxID=30207 RepID=UPI001CA84588|nr:ataxin-3-like isoform X1 [Polistes fuscatus]
MENIFHEKQEGYLCAQHCLNALLQGAYFTAVDLANFGHQMDEAERIRMAESGIDSEDYKLFLEQPSENMDDSGYFSVQVISSALKGVWGLELVPYNSTEPAALMAQNDPSKMKAYICNYKGHWFTIRKIGTQWFNLNSMLTGPQLISDTYLAMYLAQLLQEGYSIFIVIGTLPQCPADEILMKNPIKMPPRTKESVKEEKPMATGYRLGTKEEDEVMKAVRALKEIKVPSSYTSIMSSKFMNSSSDHKKNNLPKEGISSNEKPRERIIPIRIEGKDDLDEENEELQKALRLSLQDNEDDIDKNLNLRLESHADNKISPSTEVDDTDQDDELRKAVQLSLECVTAPPTPDLEDLRWRRLSHFGVYSKTSNNETSPKLNS